MKIGILTFHCAHNYGAVLQAYALQEHLLGLGHEVYIIDYRPDYLVEPYKVFSWKRLPKGLLSIKILLGECLRLRRRLRRYDLFDSFIDQYMHLLPMDFDKVQNMDILFFGGDQIWNKTICGGKYDFVYLGNFEGADDKKKIAYAASVGNISTATTDVGFIAKQLQNFEALGVREESCRVLLLPILFDKVYKVLDPTLLVSSTVFNKILIKPSIHEKYVLVYQAYMGESGKGSKNIVKMAEQIAKKIGGIVIDLSFYLSCIKHKYVKIASPSEFLGYIKYADCVITNSFHGTALSIVYRKNFYSVKMNSAIDERTKSLLTDLDLTDRLVEYSANIECLEIDYTNHISRLSKLRYKSNFFIENIIKTV